MPDTPELADDPPFDEIFNSRSARGLQVREQGLGIAIARHANSKPAELLDAAKVYAKWLYEGEGDDA